MFFFRDTFKQISVLITRSFVVAVSAFALVIALSLTACFDADTYSQNPGNSKMPEAKTSVAVADSVDPYVASNMKKALVALMKRNAGGGSPLSKPTAVAEAEEFEIKPNYLYVRFLPYGKEQKSQLFRHDSNLVLFDRPMGEGLGEDSDSIGYHDPTLSDSVSPYFATVPVGYSFDPKIKVEVIKSLFLVQPIVSAVEGDAFDGAVGPLEKTAAGASVQALLRFLEENGLTLQDLEAASLELTGHLNSENYGVAPNGLAKRSFWSRWRPSGTLKYKDTHLGDQPVHGVRVTAGYWYYWRSSRTDANGYFVSPERWTYSVKYKAHWDADDFMLQDHEYWLFGDIVSEGPTSKSSWNRTFVGEHANYAIIFTAAYDYYYKPIDGLNRPRQNAWYNTKLDIQVSQKLNTEAGGIHGAWGVTWIAIWTKWRDNKGVVLEKSSSHLYGTTIHELAHSSHHASYHTKYFWIPSVVEWNYLVENRLQESFAVGIEWWLSRKKYAGYSPGYNEKYTGLLEDLVDTGVLFSDGLKTGDRVSGFTARQIERAVEASFTLTQLRDKLKSMYPVGSGPVYTSADLDALFQYWLAWNK
jgi:hypothetical protein